jgi:hypothetical protein
VANEGEAFEEHDVCGASNGAVKARPLAVEVHLLPTYTSIRTLLYVQRSPQACYACNGMHAR